VPISYRPGPSIVPVATGGVIQIKTRTLAVTRKNSPAHGRWPRGVSQTSPSVRWLLWPRRHSP